jgi:hypothetical protein
MNWRITSVGQAAKYSLTASFAAWKFFFSASRKRYLHHPVQWQYFRFSWVRNIIYQNKKPTISIGFSSQWNFGKKIHSWLTCLFFWGRPTGKVRIYDFFYEGKWVERYIFLIRFGSRYTSSVQKWNFRDFRAFLGYAPNFLGQKFENLRIWEMHPCQSMNWIQHNLFRRFSEVFHKSVDPKISTTKVVDFDCPQLYGCERDKWVKSTCLVLCSVHTSSDKEVKSG